MFAGRSEAAGPVDIDCSHSELVPSAGSDVGQLDTLLCSLRDRWGGEQTAGVRVHTGSQPHVSLLPHQSSVCFSLPNFQRHCDSEECATVCNGPSAQCNTFTAVACGTLGHVKQKFLGETNPKHLIKRITHITTTFDVEGQNHQLL